MVVACCVVGCNNRDVKGNGISFFRFPKVNKKYSKSYQEIQLERRKAWIAAINRKYISEENVNTLRVCSFHFISG